MDINVYEQIKMAVEIREVAERYGVVVGRNNMASCFMHEDKHPSMSFKNGRFKCFSCGKGGTIIDFACEMFGLAPGEAAKKINDDFNLGLDLEKPISTIEITRRQAEDALYKGFKDWERRAWNTVSEYLLQLRSDIDTYRPIEPDKPTHERYIKALHERDYIEYLVDILAVGTFEDKLDMYKTCRKEIEQIEQGRRNRTA